jgi:putative peptidoglycan lipid II flippase
VFSGAVGSTATGSAYTAANALPNVLFEVAVGGALASVAVPLLAAPLARHLTDDASRTASALMTWTLTVLLPLGAVLVLASRPLAGLVVDAGVDSAHPGTRTLAAQLIAMFAAQVPLYGVGVVASGALQAAKRFFWPALAPLLSSLTVTGVYIWFAALARGSQDSPGSLPGSAVGMLGWGTTAGVVMLTLPLLIPMRRAGIRLSVTYRFAPGLARRASGLVGAGIGGLLAQQVFVLTAVMVAGHFGATGALPVFNYAQAVYLLPYAVLVMPVATAAFPHLAAASTTDRAGFGQLTAQTSRTVTVVGLAGAAGLIACAPAVQLVFEAIDPGMVIGLSATLTALAVGLPGYGLLTHLQRVLLAAGRTGLAAAGTAAGWLVAAALAVIAARSGAGGLDSLGWGSAAGMTIGGVALLVAARRALGPAALAGWARTAGVGGVSAAIAALAGRLVTEWLAGIGTGAGFGAGALGSLGAGLIGVVVAVAVVALGAIAGDRSAIKVFRREVKS